MTTVSTAYDNGRSWAVDAATSASNAAYVAANSKKTTGQNVMDQTSYLKLMTAQLKYQDPFEPMDNAQMVGQMTQFSQLAGQTEANASLKSIAQALSGSRLSDAANWIGKSMLVKSPVAAPTASGSYAGQVTLSADAEAVSIDLVDKAGAVVRTIDLGAQKAGDAAFYWDGKAADGTQAATGPLSIRVRGATPTATAAWATVAAVQSPASGADAKLVTTLGTYTAADAITLS